MLAVGSMGAAGFWRFLLTHLGGRTCGPGRVWWGGDGEEGGGRSKKGTEEEEEEEEELGGCHVRHEAGKCHRLTNHFQERRGDIANNNSSDSSAARRRFEPSRFSSTWVSEVNELQSPPALVPPPLPPLTSSVYLCKHRVCVYTHARARALACVYLRAVQKVVVNISQIRGGGGQGMWFQTIQPPSKITGVKPVITGRRLLICGRHQAGRWVKRRRPLRSNITIGKHPKRRRMRRNSIEAGSMALAPMTSPVNEIKCGAGGQTIAG